MRSGTCGAPGIMARMNPRAVPVQTAAPGVPWSQRLSARWWRRQTPARQDRFATLAPLVSVLLFLAAIVSAFWTLRNEEFEREAESVKRDAEIAQQQIRLRLIENQEQLVQLARQIVNARDRRRRGAATGPYFRLRTPRGACNHLDRCAAPQARQLCLTVGRCRHPPAGQQRRTRTAIRRCAAARRNGRSSPRATLRQPVYSRPFKDAFGTAVFQIHVPLLNGGVFAGALIVEYLDRRLAAAISCRRKWRAGARCRCSTKAATCWPARSIALPRPRQHAGADQRTTCRFTPSATAWCCAAQATAPRRC